MKINQHFLEGGGGVHNKNLLCREYGYFLELHIEQEVEVMDVTPRVKRTLLVLLITVPMPEKKPRKRKMLNYGERPAKEILTMTVLGLRN